ncbi:MAG: L-fucose/L-arabinose isomerase family protein [Anaerolineae bacterium]|jgi:L-fucose isomerase-like protein
MQKVKLGFVPAHRVPFSEDWARDMRRRCLEVMERIPDVEFVVPGDDLTAGGLVRDDADADRVTELFRREGVQGIVIGAMTFGDEVAAVAVAQNLPGLPVLLFGTKEGDFLPDGGRRSDSFCGTLSISSGLYRRRIPFAFAGILFPEEPVFTQELQRFAATCNTVSNFRGARVGMVGPRPERFETCAFDEVAMIENFGQRLVPIALSAITLAARDLKDDDPRVQSIVADIQGRLDTAEAASVSVMRLAKLERALLDFAESKGVTAMGLQCWNVIQADYGVTPCLAMGRLTEQGIMTACEVDVYGALTMLAQYEAARRVTVPHFIDWTIQHQEMENVFFAWHCGNAPVCLRAEGCPPRLREHSILSGDFTGTAAEGTAEFQVREGTVTLSRLVEYGNQFKMLITKGQIVPDDRELRGSWSWVQVEDLDLLYRTLVSEGFIHHASMIHGDITAELAQFCQFVGIDVVVV